MRLRDLKIPIPEEFNPYLIFSIKDGFEEDFKTDINTVGASDLPFGLRKLVIKKREGIQFQGNMKTLAGKMIHYCLQKPEVMEETGNRINEALGLNVEGQFIKLRNGRYIRFELEAEKEQYIEFNPNQFLRLHSDESSEIYTIEIKTTTMPKKMWGDILPYNLMQLNTYMGFNQNPLGFLWKIDLNFIKSTGKWEYVWNNYFGLYPIEFNEELFEFTINKGKEYFRCINENVPIQEIPCPEFPEFECKDECNQYCPNQVEKVKIDHFDECIHCKERIDINTTALIRNGKMYHYTKDKQNRYYECVEACKKAWRVEDG